MRRLLLLLLLLLYRSARWTKEAAAAAVAGLHITSHDDATPQALARRLRQRRCRNHRYALGLLLLIANKLLRKKVVRSLSDGTAGVAVAGDVNESAEYAFQQAERVSKIAVS